MNQPEVSLVVTSISSPNDVLKSLAQGCVQHGMSFYVIGDVPSPSEFHLDGCRYLSLSAQAETGFQTASKVPQRHYARKNIGYLLAIQQGVKIIIETDDDNFPLETFWQRHQVRQTVPTTSDKGWLNVYRYFSDAHIWPRGLPLDAIHQPLADFESLPSLSVECPFQQGLADENPDVDAIYRLLLPLPIHFRQDRRIALSNGVWCPFNSQNTTWFRGAFPLLYLPSYCSFRMTDIWRSFIAQRIGWECNWNVLFHEPTVYQQRNEHSLMKDFEDEVPGYLQNRRICDLLANLSLKAGTQNLTANLHVCYEELVSKAIFPAREMELVEAWISDLEAVLS